MEQKTLQDTPLKTPAEHSENVRVSLVIPLLNEEESLPELCNQIRDALAGQTYEIIFVDDGSTDTSWQVITDLAKADSCIRAIRLRRNYGKSIALQEGFDAANGEFVVTLDADLQDDPHEVPEMIAMLEDGLDMVSGWKKIRHDPISKTLPSKFFNFVTSTVTGIKLHDFNCGLKAYRRDVVKNIRLYGEMHRYVPLLASKEGFRRIGEKVVKHHPRKYGHTKFGLGRFVKGFLDLVTVQFINTYLERPMHFFGSLGTLSFLAGGAITAYLVFMRLVFDEYLSRRPLLIFGVLFLLLGVQFFAVGLLGELVNRNTAREKPANIREVI